MFLLLVLLIVIVSRNEFIESLVAEKTDKIKEQSRLLQAAEKEANIGHWQYTIDNQIIYWSEQTYKIHGVDKQKFTPDLKSAINFYHPEDQERLKKTLEDSIKKASPFSMQARIITPKNKIVDVISRGRVEQDKSGKVVSLFGTFQDITDLLDMQRKLIKSEEHYKLTTEGANIGLWDWKVPTNEVYFNKQWYTILGYEPYELPESFETFESLCHAEDLKKTKEILEDHLTGKRENYQQEIRMKHKKGHWVWVMTSGQAMERDANGQATRVSGIHLDVTEQIQTQDKLRAANEELEEFAYRTSHDLRSPLVSSLGLVSIVNDSLEEGRVNDAKEASQLIRESISNLLSLIEDLLVLAETKNLEEEKTIINVEKLIDEAINKLQNSENFEKITIEKDIKYFEEFFTKEKRFNLIVENLISNAIKYYDPDKKNPFIKVSINKKNDNLLLEVEDNGLRIHKNMKTQLFKMFKRFHPRVSYGSGLGLYMIKKSVIG